MTAAWQRALSLLRKSATPDDPSEVSKARGRSFTATPSWDQAQREIEECYADTIAERQTAMRSIATFGERREALLLQSDTDADIIKLGLEIDRSNQILSRLDVVEPELLARLGDVKVRAREDRLQRFLSKWTPEFKKFSAIEAEYTAQRNRWASLAENCASDFYDVVYVEHQSGAPDIWALIPHLAPLRRYTETFDQQMARFERATLTPHQASPALYRSLASYIELARMTGAIPPDCPMVWRLEVERALQQEVRIELTAEFIDTDGVHHKKGAVLSLLPEIAEARVSSGRAIYRS